MPTIADLLSFLPAWPPRPDALLGVAAALAAAGVFGELVFRLFRLPRITGYAVAGILISTMGYGVSDVQLPRSLRAIVDVALALLLFELGSHVHLRWLRANPWLLLTSLAESLLTFAVVAALVHAMNFSWETSVAVAAIAVSTSPAIVMWVTSEFKSSGQVTERLMLLTSLNCVYSVFAIKIVLGYLRQETVSHWAAAALQSVYLIGGSIILGLVLAWVFGRLIRTFDLREENSSLLLLSAVLLALAVARLGGLSTLLVPLVAGIVLRNRDPRPYTWPRHFGTAGGVLVVLMFVITGMSLSIDSFVAGGLAAVGLVLARVLAKVVGVLAFSLPSGMSLRQGFALGIALAPMSGVAFALTADLALASPRVGSQIGVVVLSAIAILEVLGPLAVKWALQRTNETHV